MVRGAGLSGAIPVAFAIPGDLATPTGGYVYDRRVMALLPGHGIQPRVLALPGSFPFPSQADLDLTRAALESVAPHETILADGLAWGAFAPALASGLRAPVVALCHHPLGLEAGLTPEQARAFLDNERAMLALSDHVIVSSRTTRDTIAATVRSPAATRSPSPNRASIARRGRAARARRPCR